MSPAVNKIMAKNPEKKTRASGRRGAKPQSAAEKAASAATIKRFREAKNWKPEQLAELLDVHVTAVYAFERVKGASNYAPSKDTYIKLANLAYGSDWQFVKDFLVLAGMELKTMEQIADNIHAERISSTDANVLISSLEYESNQLSFPSALIDNLASTRFLRLPYIESTLFSPGDIILLDTLVTDLRKLEDRSLIAISIGANKNMPFSIAIGTLVKQGTIFMLIGHDGKSLFLGDVSDAGQPVRDHFPVMGKVVAWMRVSDGSAKRLS